MNEDQAALVESLRDDGYTVIIFTPDELRNLSLVDTRYMENLLVTKGREFIETERSRRIIDEQQENENDR